MTHNLLLLPGDGIGTEIMAEVEKLIAYTEELSAANRQLEAANTALEEAKRQLQVFEVKDPSEAFLPSENVSSRYVFARNFNYFVYPNNYNHFVAFYRNTFQHGGISLEEMLIPFVVLEPK